MSVCNMYIRTQLYDTTTVVTIFTQRMYIMGHTAQQIVFNKFENQPLF